MGKSVYRQATFAYRPGIHKERKVRPRLLMDDPPSRVAPVPRHRETCYFRYNHVFFLVQTRIIHVSPRITSYHVRIGPIPADTGIGPVSAKK